MSRVTNEFDEHIWTVEYDPEQYTKNNMAIKHLTPKSMKELQRIDVPIWKRRESWRSPLVIFILIGYGIYYTFFGIFWISKWIILSPIIPFVYSKKLCNIEMHKWRVTHAYSNSTQYECLVCQKKKEVTKFS